ASVVGVDLGPMRPGCVPPDCVFEVHDAEKKEWTLAEPLDLVPASSTNGGFADWEGVLGRAYSHSEPGGCPEIQDSVWPLACDDGTLE
ncbi:hypothetical protein LX36DRAFT_531715, partial [Colletotrichum falcatum]